ncbi:diacylglycerol/lipid kinase family protein [Propionibacterium freudenreichii]|uniref:diacylglycerol/lipid kinase family protein n=1 Tax=Propionibacterium freudenreichii TaxID=1744 RepID=UPI000BC33E9D|nr:diacylglycerol kinase family protein [Propionibacterium freudenreichii]SBN44100.1 Diacylglycerol kinase [Propionibacterium freudenreichii]
MTSVFGEARSDEGLHGPADPARVTLLVSPSAGHGMAHIMAPGIALQLRRRLPHTWVDVEVSTSAHQARQFAAGVVAHAARASAGQRPDVLATLGGDGTASIGINACAGSGIPLAVFPAGTGDDFRRGAGSPARPARVIDAIVGGFTKRIDLMRATSSADPDRPPYWVGSVVSTGYDARVNRRVNRSVVNLGKLSYAAAVFQEAMHFKPLHYVLGIDHGVRRDVEALLVAVGNCGYFGGGINVCPAADPTDGELDVTIVHPVGVGTLMREFPNLYNGTFVRLEQVETLRCTSIHVDGDGLFALADGEEIGDVPIDLDVVPASLDVFVNRPLPHMTTPE